MHNLWLGMRQIKVVGSRFTVLTMNNSTSPVLGNHTSPQKLVKFSSLRMIDVVGTLLFAANFTLNYLIFRLKIIKSMIGRFFRTDKGKAEG